MPDGRLGRNPLKGALGDALHAVMCSAGHNLRLILAALRLYCARFGLPMPVLIRALAVYWSARHLLRTELFRADSLERVMNFQWLPAPERPQAA